MGNGAWASNETLVTGTVTATRSEWDPDGRKIVTTTTIATADGVIELQQLGGSKDGVGMVVIHGPAIPKAGQEVTARVTGDGKWIRELRAGLLSLGGNVADLPRMEFTRTLAEQSRVPLRWASGCVFLSFAAEGTSQVAGDTEFQVMADSITEWLTETSSCSYLDVSVDGLLDSEVGFDRVNLVKFREQFWGRPAIGKRKAETYLPEAGALTTLFFVDDECPGGVTPCPEANPHFGEILDADIEINGINFAISVNDRTSGGAPCLSDLANTFTHELGHLFGLDHTCFPAGADGPRPLDDTGQPIPRCDSPDLSAEVEDATMFNFQECGETKKTSLELDDVSGFCQIYPLANDPGSCEPVAEPKGCCSVGDRSPDPWNLAFVGLVLLRLAHRSRRRRH